jgi:hypothetical protein
MTSDQKFFLWCALLFTVCLLVHGWATGELKPLAGVCP